ncbi:hypothetical protein [Planctomicrobium sp. SH664]|uniref:hypothetical protein n=1 Tax=Planctomicrobium sp. SH664 TaxID=3448125 RepID=UPI003F5C4A0F
MPSQSMLPRLLFLELCLLSWLGMQIVHEQGHLVAAWGTGSRVTAVVLHPLAISRTDVSPNLSPRLVIWMGPCWGAGFPVLVWLVSRKVLPRQADLFRFFAGFCLIANGAYLSSGLWSPVGDAWDLRNLGTPVWQFGLFAAATIPAGVLLWDGLGGRFGLSRPATATSLRELGGVTLLLLGVIAIELICSGR